VQSTCYSRPWKRETGRSVSDEGHRVRGTVRYVFVLHFAKPFVS
jgi:hypothetical protein